MYCFKHSYLIKYLSNRYLLQLIKYSLKTLAGDIQSDKYICDEQLYKLALKYVYNISKSYDVAKYCFLIGADMSGGYVEISAKMIKQFSTNLNVCPNNLVNIPTYCNQA